MVFTFRFDESYNNRSMCVGGWIAEEREWDRLESQWQKRLAFENRNSDDNQKITRFHAANLNCYEEEFEHWSPDMSASFVKALLEIIVRRRIGAVSCGLDMSALVKVFPEDEPNKKKIAYGLCIKQLMVGLAHKLGSDDQVLLIHDHGDWDAEAEAAYKKMVEDTRWEPRRKFQGILTLTWEESIGLQASDLIAYETFKLVDKVLFHNSRELRKALSALVRERVPISARYIHEPALLALREQMQSDNASSVMAVLPQTSSDEDTEGEAEL